MQRVARKETRFVGLDVHAQTIAVAVATKEVLAADQTGKTL